MMKGKVSVWTAVTPLEFSCRNFTWLKFSFFSHTSYPWFCVGLHQLVAIVFCPGQSFQASSLDLQVPSPRVRLRVLFFWEFQVRPDAESCFVRVWPIQPQLLLLTFLPSVLCFVADGYSPLDRWPSLTSNNLMVFSDPDSLGILEGVGGHGVRSHQTWEWNERISLIFKIKTCFWLFWVNCVEHLTHWSSRPLGFGWLYFYALNWLVGFRGSTWTKTTDKLGLVLPLCWTTTAAFFRRWTVTAEQNSGPPKLRLSSGRCSCISSSRLSWTLLSRSGSFWVWLLRLAATTKFSPF